MLCVRKDLLQVCHAFFQTCDALSDSLTDALDFRIAGFVIQDQQQFVVLT